MLEHTPRFTTPDVAKAVRDLFGIVAGVRPLTGERDQNFMVTPESGEPFVLKVANAAERVEMLEAQQAVLRHLAGATDLCPRVLDASGESLHELVSPAGVTHQAWRVSVLPGAPLARQARRTPALLAGVGAAAARLDLALASFDNPAVHRDFPWDLAGAREAIDRRRALVTDPALAAAIDSVLRSSESRWSLLGALPVQVIHNDLNDHNILVGGEGDLYQRGQRVTGVFDFGDMVTSPAVADLAVASAYLMLGARDPLGAMAHVVRGYDEVRSLGADEIDVVFDLARLRLALSACMAAEQQRVRPEDPYLGVSQDGIRAALPRLAAITSEFATALLRDACGRDPVPACSAVTEHLARLAASVEPVALVRPPVGAKYALVDLGVSSPLLSGNPAENDEPRLTPRIEQAMRDSGSTVGVGRYLEPRLLYRSPAFAPEGDPHGESRTVHLGLDLFAPAGTPVHAPLDGVIHAFHDNATPLDYGPVIILEHRTDDGTPFFTLYGHLSGASLEGKRPGDSVRRGEAFATLGTAHENVCWTPHLHVQVITDLLGMGVDFPGVARASQRRLWERLSPDANLVARVPAGVFPAPTPATAATLATRRARFGRNLSLAYRDPGVAVRGWMQFLFDDTGRRYLDAYNNVPHVGHSHPRVVEAVHRQFRLLSTNTRYLSDVTNEYAERLCGTLPAGLDTCWLVNSASEANELALRLARAATGRKDVIVLDGAYHGNTTSLIDVSPWKHGGPGGAGAPDWVHVAPLPDDYRGEFRRADPAAGSKYAARVGAMVRDLAARGRPPGAFIAETCPSVGGQIMLPAGYLQGVYEAVRSVGGVTIADEVQTGLGRIGTHMWAFEAHHVVPDIVVMGKPLGNGFPLAAVVTTRAIAETFDNGMEYFSTFGGNQAGCAAGLAVVDVLRDEGLQEHARVMGEAMLAAMSPWTRRHPVVGDVRGSGLFLGVELVRDRVRLAPAAAEAAYVANRMREEGILLGTDGPFYNVLKVRPPMPFDHSDAARLVETMDGILGELA